MYGCKVGAQKKGLQPWLVPTCLHHNPAVRVLVSECSSEVAFPDLDTIISSLFFRGKRLLRPFASGASFKPHLLNLVCTGRWPLKARL